MTTYQTGNPIGSTDPRDLYDNAENLDEAVNNTVSDSWRDRMGRSRLTWEAIAKAGTGDTGVAIDAANRAVGAAGQAENDADRAASAASRAENAEAVVDAANIEAAVTRAETARDAAFVNADVYPDVASGRAAVADGEQFQVASAVWPNEIRRFRRDSFSASTEVARYPRAGFSIANAALYAATGGRISVDTSTKTITFLAGIRVVCGAYGIVISGSKTLNYSGATGTQILAYYDTVSEQFGYAEFGSVLPLDAAVFGSIRTSTGELLGAVPSYSLDGVRVSPYDRGLALTGDLFGNSSNLVVDHSEKTVTISGNPRVMVSSGGSFTLPNQVLSYGTGASLYLAADSSNGQVSLLTSSEFNVGSGGGTGIRNNNTMVVFARLNQSTGVIQGLNLEGSGEVDSYTTGTIYGSASGVVMDTESRTIAISGRTFFPNGSNILPSANPVSYDGTVIAPYLLVMSRTSGDARLIRAALHTELLPDDAIVAGFDPATEILSGIPGGYTLNGRVIDAPSIEGAVPTIPKIGWDMPGVYSAPPMPGYRPSSAIPMNTVDSFMIQGWFDDLASQHPEYITRTLLGNTATGLPVYEYRFKPDMGASSVQPRVMIQGGIHAEAMSYVLPYHVMDLIANNWEGDPILEAFRWGLDISVIPVVNPYGVNNSQRENSNGVDLNRNYPTFWTSGATHGSTFLSELETQYSFQIMKEFKPHIMLDMHYFGTPTSGPEEGAFLWFPGFTQGTLRAGQSMINRMARKWKEDHPWMPPASVLDRGAGALVSPGAAVDTAIAMGAEAITFETGDLLLGDPSTSSRYSELAVKCGVEAVINYLMILLRR